MINSNLKMKVKIDEFTHIMKTKKVIAYNNNISREKREAEDEASYVLFKGRPLVHSYTRHITSPFEKHLDVYAVYSIEPDKNGYYRHLYSMVLDKEEVEEIKK